MATQKTEPAPKGGIMHLLMASVGVSILGLAAGFFGGAALLAKDAPLENAQKQTVSPAVAGEGSQVANAADGEKQSPAEYNIVPLQPIITNLADSASVWVRLEGSVLIDKKSDVKQDVLALKLSQHVLAYLRTLKLTDVQGVGALPAISQDLDEIVQTLSDGQAHGVLISGLVFE
jgi:flagellar protein FliL